MPRDFRVEITAAVQANDLAALAAIAHNLLGRVEQDDERRARQAEKKRLQRSPVPGRPGTNSQEMMSGTSGMSPNVSGRPGTSGDVPTVDPPLRSKTTPPPSAQVIAKLGDSRLQHSLDLLRAKFDAEQWEDVASFFLRRKYDRWLEWSQAMLRDVGPGSQYEPIDLLRVCQDDGTLEKRIGSAGVLRKFLAISRQERVGQQEREAAPQALKPVPRQNGTSVTAGRASLVFGQIRGFMQESQPPGQALKRFIPRAKVEALGADVVKAFEAVGGSDAIVNAQPDKIGFLIRDFTKALEAAHAAA